MTPKMLLEWFGTQLFQISFAGVLAYSVVLLGEVDSVGEKFGVGAVIAALGIAFGKYFAFRPKTIEAQAASRRSDAEQIRQDQQDLITELKKVHQERVDYLLVSLNDMQLRAEKGEAQVAAGRHTRHLITNELTRVQLRALRYEMMMEVAKLPFEPMKEVDMASLTAEEDEVSRKTRVEPVVTLQQAKSAENTAAIANASGTTTMTSTITTNKVTPSV